MREKPRAPKLLTFTKQRFNRNAAPTIRRRANPIVRARLAAPKACLQTATRRPSHWLIRPNTASVEFSSNLKTTPANRLRARSRAPKSSRRAALSNSKISTQHKRKSRAAAKVLGRRGSENDARRSARSNPIRGADNPIRPRYFVGALAFGVSIEKYIDIAPQRFARRRFAVARGGSRYVFAQLFACPFPLARVIERVSGTKPRAARPTPIPVQQPQSRWVFEVGIESIVIEQRQPNRRGCDVAARCARQIGGQYPVPNRAYHVFTDAQFDQSLVAREKLRVAFDGVQTFLEPTGAQRESLVPGELGMRGNSETDAASSIMGKVGGEIVDIKTGAAV